MLDFSHVISTPGVNIDTFFGGSSAIANTSNSFAGDWKSWTKPRGINWIYMIAVGGGSSGTAGTATNTNAAAAGATGGSSGSQSMLLIPAMFVPNQLFILPGSGGRLTGTYGVGWVSGQVQFGTSTFVAVEPITTLVSNFILVMLAAHNGSNGGSPSLGQQSLAGRGVFNAIGSQAGGAAGATQTGAGGSITAPTTGLMVTGGAGSGGKDVTGSTRGTSGSVSISSGLGGTIPTILAGVQATTGVDATAGGNGSMIKPYQFLGGAGGGSGGFAASGVGDFGGDGGRGGPGCGGGAGGPGYTTPGRGGDGGDGFVIIVSW